MSVLQWFATHPNTKSTSWAVLRQPLTPVPPSLWAPQQITEVLLTTGRKGHIAMEGARWHTVPLPAGWPPGHFPSAQPRPAGSTRCRQPAQPGGRGTPSPPQSASRHRECPASAGHLSRGEYWYSAPLTHTHTWGSQSSHPQTCRSHPAGHKEEKAQTRWWGAARSLGECSMVRFSPISWYLKTPASSPLMLKSKEVPRERYHDWYRLIQFDVARFHPVMPGLPTCPTDLPPQNQNSV